jgi:hypothetical protein
METLKIQIACGEKTCALAPGNFCEFLRTRKFGTVYFCAIWHEEDDKGRPLHMEEVDGWLLRRPECLAAAKGEE